MWCRNNPAKLAEMSKNARNTILKSTSYDFYWIKL